MKKVTLMTIAAIIILGIYVLPSVTARLAGSHTWELNATGGASQLQCGKCHVYITNEINSYGSGLSNVVTAHQAAAGNSKYINNTGGWINVATPNNASVDGICAMCHVTENSGYVGHTQVTIRACTDGDCHGESDTGANHARKQTVFGGQKLNITAKLTLDADAHSRFYNPLTSRGSTYTQEGDTDTGGSSALNGGNYTQGFYACLGCHTHIGVQMQVVRPSIINFSITGDGYSFIVSAVNVNTTALNTTMSMGTSGNKWS